MEEKEAYEVLGVSNGASREEIQQAYREKVKEFHPDISDHDEALTKFKRVKEAYETLGSRRVSEFQGEESDGDSEAGKDTRTDERTNDKVNLSSSTETTSERTTAGDEGGEEPEGFETVKQYGQGWRLAFEEDGRNWFVFKEYETSPYTDEKEMIYLDSRGEESESPVYFGSRGRAEEAYLEGFGKGDRRAEDRNGTGESEDGDTDGGWSDVQEENRLDPLWVLYSQTKKERGKIRRRWGVGTDVTEDNRFINADGEYQEDEFWFDERARAKQAYSNYVERRKGSTDESREDASSGSVSGDSKRSHVSTKLGSAASLFNPLRHARTLLGVVRSLTPSTVLIVVRSFYPRNVFGSVLSSFRSLKERLVHGDLVMSMVKLLSLVLLYAVVRNYLNNSMRPAKSTLLALATVIVGYFFVSVSPFSRM